MTNHMNTGKQILAVIAMLALGPAAFATDTPPTEAIAVTSGATQSPAKGYLAGVFASDTAILYDYVDYCFIVQDTSTRKEFIMPFYKRDKRIFPGRPAQMNMIELLPGRYRLTNWGAFGGGFMHYDNFLKDVHGEAIFFDIKPGRITLLGRYVAVTVLAGLGTKTRPVAAPISQDDAIAHLIVAYPHFNPATLDFDRE